MPKDKSEQLRQAIKDRSAPASMYTGRVEIDDDDLWGASPTTPADSAQLAELQVHNQRLSAELEQVRAQQAQGASIVALNNNAIQFTRVGAMVSSITPDDWRIVMGQLKSIQQAFAWVVGDMLVYATSQKWGEIDAIYQHTSQALDIPVKTLQNWSSVARNVEISRRREILTLSHHIEVQGQNPDWQIYLLEQAEARKLSVAQLRQVVVLLNTGSDIEGILDQVTAMRAKPSRFDSLRQSQQGARAGVLAGYAKPKERQHWLSYAEEQAREWARLLEELKGKKS
jgi:hypothetical protein